MAGPDGPSFLDQIMGKTDEWTDRGSVKTQEVGATPGVVYVKPKNTLSTLDHAQAQGGLGPMGQTLVLRMLARGRTGGAVGAEDIRDLQPCPRHDVAGFTRPSFSSPSPAAAPAGS